MFPFDDVIMNIVISLETHFLQEHFLNQWGFNSIHNLFLWFDSA